MNNDSLEDFILASLYTVEIVLQNPDGSFQNASVLAEVDGYGELLVGDLDGDAATDICTVNNSGSLIIMIGNGTDTFQAEVVSRLTNGDFIQRLFPVSTQNGTLIGMITSGPPKRLLLFLVTDSWNLIEERNLTLSDHFSAVLSHDFDGDGNDEIVFAQPEHNLTILYPFSSSTATATLELPPSIYLERDVYLQALDVDGDGSDEIVMATNTEDMTGQLAFIQVPFQSDLTPYTWSYSSGWSGATAGNFDEDSDADVILTSFDGHTILIENELSGTVSKTELLPKTDEPFDPVLIHRGADGTTCIAVRAIFDGMTYGNYWGITLFWTEEESESG